MGKYFSISELCNSATAIEMGITNTAGEMETRRLNYLIDYVLDPIRERWGKPIRVTSGYRNERLNKKVGGKDKSQHMLGEAADIVDVGGDNAGLWRCIIDLFNESKIEFDQLINEKHLSWIHISYRIGIKNRKQVLSL